MVYRIIYICPNAMLCIVSLLLASCKSSDDHQDNECNINTFYDSATRDEPGTVNGGVFYVNDVPALFFGSSVVGEERMFFVNAKGRKYIISHISNETDGEDVIFIMCKDFLVSQVYLLQRQNNARQQYIRQDTNKSKSLCQKYLKVWGEKGKRKKRGQEEE